MPYKDLTQQRAYQLKWMHARRRQRLAGLICVRCGSSEDIEIDHIDPSKKVSHRIWSWKEKRYQAEIKKCQPLCGACHKAKTREDYLKFVTHCPQGHRYDEKNTYIRKHPYSRKCRMCYKLRARRRRALQA